MAAWKTAIIEDQVLFRDLLVKLVTGDARFECVGSAGDAEAGLALCLRTEPDLIVLDVNLPGMNGLDMAALLRARHADAHILALTSLKDELTITRILELELTGYVEKDQPVAVLEEAMLAVAQGRRYHSATFEDVRRRMGRDPLAVGKILSPREREILALVAKGRTSGQIAAVLGLSERTVSNHRYNMMRKLEVHSVAELVAFAVRTGGA